MKSYSNDIFEEDEISLFLSLKALSDLLKYFKT